MARRALARPEDAAWAKPRFWLLSPGYSTPKLTVLSGGGFSVLLHLPEDCTAVGGSASHPLAGLISGAQQLLIGPSDGSSPPDGAPSVLVMLDLSPLCADASSASAALDAEGASATLTKGLGKPAARALEKLLAGTTDVTLLAHGGGAQLALKLLRAGAEEHGLKPGTVSRLVLMHPRLPPPCINKQLSGPPAGEKAAPGGAAQLDVVFETEPARDRRLPMLRHAFPSVRAMVASGSAARLLAACGASSFGREILSPPNWECVGDAKGLGYNAGQSDAAGRTLQAAELVYEMSRMTKQHEPRLLDLAGQIAPILRAAAANAPPPGGGVPPAAPLTADAPDGCGTGARELDPISAPAQAVAAAPQANLAGQPWPPTLVGALVLRGSRCVLVRSLASPPLWKGVRIPVTAVRPAETDAAAAMRAAADACDIDGATEVVSMPGVLPVALYGPAGGLPPGAVAQVHLLYASRGPPPGPLEDADGTDEEDLYDWFTCARAEAALRRGGDFGSIRTLRAAAAGLSAAAAAGHVKRQWGGVFGQEWEGGPVAGATSRVAGRLLPSIAPTDSQTASPRLHLSNPSGAGFGRAEAVWGGNGAGGVAGVEGEAEFGGGEAADAISAAAAALALMTPHQALAALAGLTAAAAAARTNPRQAPPAPAPPSVGMAEDRRSSSDAGRPCSASVASEVGCSAACCSHARRSGLFKAGVPFSPAALASALGSLRSTVATRGLGMSGIAWLATRNDEQVRLSMCPDEDLEVVLGPPWWVCVPRAEWPEGLEADLTSLGLWEAGRGDRQTELLLEAPGCAGRDAAEAALRACLLTEEEVAAGPDEWAQLADPWWDKQLEKPLFSFGPPKREMFCMPCERPVGVASG